MTMRLPPSVKLPAFPLKSPTSPNFGIYFLTFKLYSMQLTNEAVSTSTRSASIIGTSFEFRTYLISTSTLKLMQSAKQGIPFIQNPNADAKSEDSAIWIGTSIKNQYPGLMSGDSATYDALAIELRDNSSKYAIGVIVDSRGTSWVIYAKGQSQAKEMASIKVDVTADGKVVATVVELKP